MESSNHTDEARWFAFFRDVSRASITSKLLIAIITVATVADLVWEFDRADQKAQLSQRIVIAVIAVLLLSRARGPNQSSEPTLSSGTPPAEQESRPR
jgi:hypothetical protein